jgi:hypothetical protein
MNDDEVAQLNLFSGLAMHALITEHQNGPEDCNETLLIRVC